MFSVSGVGVAPVSIEADVHPLPEQPLVGARAEGDAAPSPKDSLSEFNKEQRSRLVSWALADLHRFKTIVNHERFSFSEIVFSYRAPVIHIRARGPPA